MRKSYVSLTSRTTSVLRGVTKDVVSSGKAGKGLFVFLYSTVENEGCFKVQVREV